MPPPPQSEKEALSPSNGTLRRERPLTHRRGKEEEKRAPSDNNGKREKRGRERKRKGGSFLRVAESVFQFRRGARQRETRTSSSSSSFNCAPLEKVKEAGSRVTDLESVFVRVFRLSVPSYCIFVRDAVLALEEDLTRGRVGLYHSPPILTLYYLSIHETIGERKILLLLLPRPIHLTLLISRRRSK